MGPMRFPESIQYAGTKETLTVNDMKLTFQLADVMNTLNKGQANFTVNFIPGFRTIRTDYSISMESRSQTAYRQPLLRRRTTRI